VARGDVFNASLKFPDGQEKRKHLVVIQGGPAYDASRQIATVVASTDRRNGRPLRDYEVSCGSADGFDHDTLIDCRWVFTMPRDEVISGGFITTLSPMVLARIDAALLVGLQIVPQLPGT